ncbi:hypothetical protein H4J38_02060 [Colwellia sp. BRX10-3]|uniref:hypothetical protein n=1 Tax=Colwellia sp. BRX10-3 TaxID=2759844 RepID=UPI0015F74B07|nr:hypothetical protein [Colwellia sp. BRX10-3]MBA6389556.1 hypothetical protein [Colwellia sp. BRX10-3]
MIRQTKPNFVGSIFVIVGLYCSAIQAEVKDKPQCTSTVNNVVINLELTAKHIANNYAYPSITSEAFQKHHNTHVQSLTQMSRQPLHGIQVADFVNLVPRKFDNKNSIFEFAAKFNDKLQQVLAYFDFSSTGTDSKDENISEKDSNKKVSLIAINDNKYLKNDCSVSKI